MNELMKVLNYEGTNVTFKQVSGQLFVNATEMAKAFNKRTSDYLQTQSAQEYINAHIRNNPDTVNPVTVIKGGLDQGTWMHEDIALDFAQWLSVDFRIWCNGKIKELMTTGKTSIQNISRLDMAKMLVEAEEEKERLQLQITANAPKIIFADSVAASKTSILVGELAKILKQNGIDIGQNRLFEWMREKGYLIQRKGTDYNMPTQYSMDLALFEIKETSIAHADGHTTISKTAKVTGKGQVYFINKFIKA